MPRLRGSIHPTPAGTLQSSSAYAVGRTVVHKATGERFQIMLAQYCCSTTDGSPCLLSLCSGPSVPHFGVDGRYQDDYRPAHPEEQLFFPGQRVRVVATRQPHISAEGRERIAGYWDPANSWYRVRHPSDAYDYWGGYFPQNLEPV
jgi:hypothetical protein